MFLICILTLFLASSITNAAVCKRYICLNKENSPDNQKDDTFCMNEQTTSKDRYKVMVYPDMCLSSQYCSYYSLIDDTSKEETIYSVCRNKSSIAEQIVSLPGEPCDSFGIQYSCPYGKKTCDFNRCLGSDENGLCETSKDCSPGFYCNSDSVCKSLKVLGDNCTAKEECGRNMTCYYQYSNDTHGVCKYYMSLPDGSDLVVRDTFDAFLCQSKIAEDVNASNYDNTTRAISASGYEFMFRQGPRKCGVGFKSSKKGKECSTPDDCTVTLNGTVQYNLRAECTCVKDLTGSQLCGPMNGDSEYSEFAQAWEKYFIKGRYCHIARGFEEDCGATAEFRKYKCMESKIRYYHESQATKCVKVLSNEELYPEIYAASRYCD